MYIDSTYNIIIFYNNEKSLIFQIIQFFWTWPTTKTFFFYLTLAFYHRDGDFADFSAFADFFFSASNLPHFCGFLQFLALIREREKCGKNAYKITLTEPQREMWKNCSQKISLTELQVCEPLNCERHGQCTLSFCWLPVFWMATILLREFIFCIDVISCWR